MDTETTGRRWAKASNENSSGWWLAKSNRTARRRKERRRKSRRRTGGEVGVAARLLLDSAITRCAMSDKLNPKPDTLAARSIKPSISPEGGRGQGAHVRSRDAAFAAGCAGMRSCKSSEIPNMYHNPTAQEGMISATFEVEALATVPSSTIEQYESHKVTIAVLKFEDIQLEWVTVPKVLPSVFLRISKNVAQCKVKNASNYLLLPGSASIFMDNSFISKSDLSLVSPQETFSFSLGIDPEVKATYHPIRKVTSKTGGIFNSKTITTSYVQAISVKNNRRMTLSNLTIKDNVPVSSDSRIKVNLLQPKGLQDPNDKAGSSKVTGAKEVRVSSGVVARWAAIAGDRTAVVDDNVEDDVEGTILWACNIPPGVSQDVQLSWEVTAPVGLKWK
ncbi:hypothetical protein SISNIDRAFT_470815 [Sistotremastrum niveocremeum HHB9708]|uniref:DUF4139 domain-containing protein n=1 Tax=Sistotremastrum niveocremeum HHB9708 TaxID=1314777 RepID=A0A164NFX2_9AGAM|nr:hypothetical protein SISNIDRAFT_470815 [Sistotremastrum niveocremeum HHB9708]